MQETAVSMCLRLSAAGRLAGGFQGFRAQTIGVLSREDTASGHHMHVYCWGGRVHKLKAKAA
jgi:hypothetical protein